MRTVSSLVLAAGFGLAGLTSPVRAEDSGRDLGDVASGNWAGAAGGGFFFRAELQPEADLAALRIWNGMDAIPSGSGAPELNVADFGVAAFATALRLEVAERPEGSFLQVITEFADEEAEGREVVEIQFLDFQYTITGYSIEMTLENFDAPPENFSCKVDTRAGIVVENGKERRLPAMDFEALNASSWKEAAAFDRGWCSRSGEG